MKTENEEVKETAEKPEKSKTCEEASTCQCENNIFVETMKNGFDSVFSNMKTVCLSLITCMLMVFGCTTIPTAESVERSATTIGYTAAMVANSVNMSANARKCIIEVVEVAKAHVPSTNQTFEAVWTPIAQARVDKMVDSGKLGKEESVVVMSAFRTITKAVDYMFTFKYPTVKGYMDLTIIAINAFSDGFLALFNTTNLSAAPYGIEYDEEVYNYLTR